MCSFLFLSVSLVKVWISQKLESCLFRIVFDECSTPVLKRGGLNLVMLVVLITTTRHPHYLSEIICQYINKYIITFAIRLPQQKLNWQVGRLPQLLLPLVIFHSIAAYCLSWFWYPGNFVSCILFLHYFPSAFLHGNSVLQPDMPDVRLSYVVSYQWRA